MTDLLNSWGVHLKKNVPKNSCCEYAGVSLTFSAGGQLVLKGGQNILKEPIYKNLFPDFQTRQVKPSSLVLNLPNAQPL